MPYPWLRYMSIGTLPEHCEPSSPFLTSISSALHTCLPTPLALLSSTLGTLSIVSWLFAQLPQIYKNYVIQSTSGLSPWFLVEWCLGDSANFIGAILTHQASWQIIVAAYYVFVDVVLVFQYFWYTHLMPRAFPGSECELGGGRGGTGDGLSEDVSAAQSHFVNNPTAPVPCATSLEPKGAAVPDDYPSSSTPESSLSSFSNEKRTLDRTIWRAGSSSGTGTPPLASPRTILFVSMVCATVVNASSPASSNTSVLDLANPPYGTASQMAGRVSSWVSTIMYLVSRVPQLYKNYRRKSTAGLSPLLFSAAFGGNLFYSTSLLSNPNAWFDFPSYGGGGWVGRQGNDRLEWVGRAIPFFLGAAGVLVLDGAMGVQFLIYAKKDEDGAPSAPRPKTVEGETEPLLAGSQDRYGGV